MRRLSGVPASILFGAALIGGGAACSERPLDPAGGAISSDGGPVASHDAAVAPPIGVVQLATVPADQLPWDISVDATGVYFAVAWYLNTGGTGAPGSDTQGAIRHVSRDGGGRRRALARAGRGVRCRRGNGGDLLHHLRLQEPGTHGQCLERFAAGGDARTLGTWTSHGSSIGFAVDGDAIYWGHSAGSGGALNRTDGVDGTTVALVPNVSSPVGLATDGVDAFYVTRGGIFGVPASGGDPVTIVDELVDDGPSLVVVASIAHSGRVALEPRRDDRRSVGRARRCIDGYEER
jgi:hypothetical protein